MKNARGSAIPHISYDTRGLRISDAVDFGREVVRTTYDLGLPRDLSDHWFRTEIWMLGPLLVAQNSGSGQELIRERRHLSTNPGDYLKIQIFEESGGVLHGAEGAIALEASSVHLIDQTRTYRQTIPPGGNLTVFVPYALLDYRIGSLPPHLEFGSGTGEGSVLSASTTALLSGVRTMTSGDSMGVCRAYVGMLRGLLDWRLSRQGRESIREVRMETVKRFIELNLSDPGLGPDSLLAAVGASRATLFRDFAPMGGLSGYIRERRLERAYRDLSLLARQRGVVGRVAESSGFTSISEFSRAFHRRYGVSPSEVVGLWRPDPEDLPPAGGPRADGPLEVMKAAYQWSYRSDD